MTPEERVNVLCSDYHHMLFTDVEGKFRSSLVVLIKSACEEASLEASQRVYREMDEHRIGRKARCVDNCSHSSDFVCDYEDGTSHCLECAAQKLRSIEDIITGKRSLYSYWIGLEAVKWELAHPKETEAASLAEMRKIIEKYLQGP